MDVDPAEITRWIAGDVEEEEEPESADLYVEYLAFQEADNRLQRRSALPQLPPLPHQIRAQQLEQQLNQILVGVSVAGRFSVQTSSERSDGSVARATVLVEEGPRELLNRVVRVYSLKDRNRAKQGDRVWLELRSCALDRAALERGQRDHRIQWTMSEALSFVCIFGAVLCARPGAVSRSCYLCKQSQIQWKSGVLNFIPFSHEVPTLQVEVNRSNNIEELDDVFQLLMVDWPVNRLRPRAEILERVQVPRPLPQDRSLQIFLKDLDFLVSSHQDEEMDPWDLMAKEEDLVVADATRMELDGHIFSIDTSGTGMIDDALEYDLDAQVLRVHLADVAALVLSGGDLDKAAAKKGCSCYIRDHLQELKRSVPMLPPCVTAQTSLDKGQWRRAVSFEFHLGDGEPRFIRFCRSWVRVKERLHFDAAEKLMNGTQPSTGRVARSLRDLWQWTRKEMDRQMQRSELQAFFSMASSQGNAERLVEFWMKEVNQQSGRILAEQGHQISYCSPCPDAHHFSRLAVLCREALLRAGDVEHDELLLNLRSSPEKCQESLLEILRHVTRINRSAAPREPNRPGVNRWRRNASAPAPPDTSAMQAISVLCQQLSQCVPTASYRTKSIPSGSAWPILHTQKYFQVTSPMRRWIDLLGQHLLLGTCQLEPSTMREYVESFNEMSLLAKHTSSRFAFLSFCTELQHSEQQIECVVSRIDQGTLHLACPEIAGFHRSHLVLPLQLLSSHDLAVRPIIEDKKAILTRVEDGKQLEVRPFQSKMRVQLSLDHSSPVSLYRLCASALLLDFGDGQFFRHAVLPRQHPEVFGAVPDLRRARQMHRQGGLWGETWHQVQLAKMCAAALLPQMRAKAPYFVSTSCKEVEIFSFVGREVYATVPSTYRGLRGLNRLQEGHLVIVWRRDEQQRLWMSCGRVKDVDVTEQMKRKTELCNCFSRTGTCDYGEECWYAHGADDLLEERAKVTVLLSDCSLRSQPRWVAQRGGTLDLDFVVISTREQQSLKSIREVGRTSERQAPQQLVNRLVFRGGGGGSRQAEAAIQDEADIDAPSGLPPLNNYQQKALQLTLKEVLAYVQGPPGTGKSTTAAHLICQLLLRPRPRRANPLLVCCPSNKACDRLLRLFLMADMALDKWVVRVYAKSIEQNYWGDPRSQFCRDYEIDADLLQFALHQQVEDQYPDVKQNYQEIAKTLQEGCAKADELRRLHANLNEVKKLKGAKSKEIVKQADVIFTTCDCACNDALFQKMTFPSVIIDEAAQALEPELARCCLLAEEHLALFGDHEQLGPVLTEQSLFPAFKNMWTRSLFERIVSKRGRRGGESNGTSKGIPHVTLKRQYRMHPTISAFANEEFYQFELVDSPEASREGFALPSADNSRLSVIEVTGPHGRKSVAPEGDAVQDFETSLCNVSEAAVVLAYLQWLLRLDVQPCEIAVVTPYRAQAALIKEKLAEAGVQELPTIGTVHLLQGEERQYVILSLVRSFAEADTEVFDPVPQDAGRRKSYSLGFLNDRRLANVALTRAQLGLVVVANTEVLSSASHWKNLFQYARQRGACWLKEEALDFLQRSDGNDAWNDDGSGSWGSQEDMPSGSESEGHEEASVASEASVFGSAPPSSAASAAGDSDARGGDAAAGPSAGAVAPAQRAPAPAPARRRRAKKGKAKAKAKAKATARDPGVADALALEEALAELQITDAAVAETVAAAATCCVADCRKRPYERARFASAHGLCSSHWRELLKEMQFLETMQIGGLVSPHSALRPPSLLERFIVPEYWNPPPPDQPPLLVMQKGLRSRSFFSALLRYLLEEKCESGADAELPVLFVVAFSDLIKTCRLLNFSPEHFLNEQNLMNAMAEDAPLEARSLGFSATGLALSLQAIVDCAGNVPSQFQDRWSQIASAMRTAPPSSTAAALEERWRQDVMSVAMFWKDEGNRHYKQRAYRLALETYKFGSDILKELPLSPEVSALEADLANNSSAVCIDAEKYVDAELFAKNALEHFNNLSGDPGVLQKKAKAFYRRGQALHRLGRLEEAVVDLTSALEIREDDDVRRRFVVVQGELDRHRRLCEANGTD